MKCAPTVAIIDQRLAQLDLDVAAAATEYRNQDQAARLAAEPEARGRAKALRSVAERRWDKALGAREALQMLREELL